MVFTLERVFMVQSVLNKRGKYSQEVQDLFAENSDNMAYLIDTVLVHAYTNLRKLIASLTKSVQVDQRS